MLPLSPRPWFLQAIARWRLSTVAAVQAKPPLQLREPRVQRQVLGAQRRILRPQDRNHFLGALAGDQSRSRSRRRFVLYRWCGTRIGGPSHRIVESRPDSPVNKILCRGLATDLHPAQLHPCQATWAVAKRVLFSGARRDDVPVLGQLAVLEAHDIHHDPVRGPA
jgi:hypothetical protein